MMMMRGRMWRMRRMRRSADVDDDDHVDETAEKNNRDSHKRKQSDTHTTGNNIRNHTS